MKKITIALAMLILFCSIAIAEEKELFKPTEGGSVVCENCLTDDVCKGKTVLGDIIFHCDKTCAIKRKDNANKEMWSMRLNGACVSFNKGGQAEEIRALKDSSEDLNINGYLIKIKANDYILFGYSIETISKEISFPIIHLWQEDKGFRKNRILNRAITTAKTIQRRQKEIKTSFPMTAMPGNQEAIKRRLAKLPISVRSKSTSTVRILLAAPRKPIPVPSLPAGLKLT